MTVVVDHDRGRVVRACAGHGKRQLNAFLDLLTEGRRAGVFGQAKVSEMVKGAFRFGKRKFSEMVRPTGRAPAPAPPTVRTSYR